MTSPPFPSKVKLKRDLPSNSAGKIRRDVSRPPPNASLPTRLADGWLVFTRRTEDGISEVTLPGGVGVWLAAASSQSGVRPVCLEGSQESVRSHTNRDSARGSRQEFVQGSTSNKKFSGKSGGQDEPAHNEKLKSKRGNPGLRNS